MLIYALTYVTRDNPSTPRVFTTWNENELSPVDPASDPSVNQCAAVCLSEGDVKAVRLVPVTLSDGPLLAALGQVAPTVRGSAGQPVSDDLSGGNRGEESWPVPHHAPGALKDQLVRLRYLGEDGRGGYLTSEVYSVAAHRDQFGGITITKPAHHVYATPESFWRVWEIVA